MTKTSTFLLQGLVCGWLCGCSIAQQPTPDTLGIVLRKMSGAPEAEKGYAAGVSACYSGLINNQLIMAGGCNFPEIPAAEGGKKYYYQGIYAATLTSDSILTWCKVGDLPASAAYGVSVSTPQGIVCIGGMNGEGASNVVYRISLSAHGQAILETLPSLPCTMDNFGGALLDNVVYVAGGNADGKPSNRLFCLNLNEPATGWQELPAFPGLARVQPVCAGQVAKGESLFYIWGGFAAARHQISASLSLDGYAYSPTTQQWSPVVSPVGADSVAISLGGGTAIAVSDSLIMCLGGVHKDVFLSALQREELLKKALDDQNQTLVDSLKAAAKEYMLQAPAYYQFNDRICVYNTRRNQWTEQKRTFETARAGASLVGKGNRFFSINGELKPGIRTPEIVEITF